MRTYISLTNTITVTILAFWVVTVFGNKPEPMAQPPPMVS